jgi:ABC-2 type transport system ATP-binding protein
MLKDGRVAFHETTISISDKLVFTTGRSVDEVTTLYSEPIPGGYRTISTQRNGNSSEIDIELLFNAINTGIKLNVSHEK